MSAIDDEHHAHPHADEPATGSMRNPAHAATALRLKRAHGHLHTVIAMLEQNRDCIEIAQQLQAVEAAVKKAKRSLIQEHLGHGIEDVLGRTTGAERDGIRKLLEIAKYL